MLQLAAHTTRQHAVLTATVVQRGGPGADGAVGAGAVDAGRHDQVRSESDGWLQSADTLEEHRTVRGVRRLRR